MHGIGGMNRSRLSAITCTVIIVLYASSTNSDENPKILHKDLSISWVAM